MVTLGAFELLVPIRYTDERCQMPAGGGSHDGDAVTPVAVVAAPGSQETNTCLDVLHVRGKSRSMGRTKVEACDGETALDQEHRVLRLAACGPGAAVEIHDERRLADARRHIEIQRERLACQRCIHHVLPGAR